MKKIIIASWKNARSCLTRANIALCIAYAAVLALNDVKMFSLSFWAFVVVYSVTIAYKDWAKERK